jgi:hypothetical protein
MPLEGSAWQDELFHWSETEPRLVRVLRSVDNVELESDQSLLQGGPDFMRMQRFENPEESAAWASGKGVVGGLSRQGRRAGQSRGRCIRNVYGNESNWC